MGRFWLLKIARTLLTLLFVVTLIFVVLRTSGDPVQSLLAPTRPFSASSHRPSGSRGQARSPTGEATEPNSTTSATGTAGS
jgi:ABC-type dipeptide/oligopeptide/nickel transport system permease component